jgi:CheY-like chemotaxis protein
MPASNPPRVLVVDDHPDAAEVWALYLRGEGFDVDTAHDGEEALRRVRDARPDAIVMDLNLPNLSGLDVARSLAADAATRDISLIAATGCADRSVLQAARSLFQVILSKPCDPNELVRQLHTVLDRGRV